MPPRENPSPNEGDAQNRSGRSNQPLVIVSERGRHSEASRRIVRAQAARASAAQSRETRARNREDRHQRDGPQTPTDSTPSQSIQPQPPQFQPSQPNVQVHDPQSQSRAQFQNQSFSRTQSQTDSQPQAQSQGQAGTESANPLKPLVDWMTNVLKLSATSFAAGAAILASTGRPQLSNASDVLSAAGGILSDSGNAMEQVQISGGLFNRQLPIALPRGFATLQQRISISDSYLVLLSRTACFDFGSPGVENRLNELLFDIVMTSGTATLGGSQLPGHPIQSHLRIACACLTIFQGQRADGQSFAGDRKYHTGLEAAWAEVVVLDQNALREPKSAEAALWAVFIISVTCGSTVNFFSHLLSGLMHDLQLRYWEQVRGVLIDFIYPGSFLDEPCRQFYDKLQGTQPDQTDRMIMT
ncbi:hypothetical protein PRZ48_001128 [Zasmidium cellare]|uniref:Uncharacterized protein n=1 Tax=Zasmidium cellare TaxID=395010 RepID=A0ABR0F1R6_ZASCE|nr:hypothetical protein PRZ48_001128 [Zasmidium cellare]